MSAPAEVAQLDLFYREGRHCPACRAHSPLVAVCVSMDADHPLLASQHAPVLDQGVALPF